MQALIQAWYRSYSWTLCLLPLSWIFQMVAFFRRIYLQRMARKMTLPIPLIVIGNLTVGGSGKTPTLIALTHYLQRQGYHPGIVSRGYGAHTRVFPKIVRGHDTPHECGDEPVCIAKATGATVVIDPNRTRAVNALLQLGCCDVILSDDGLQHYAMPRDIEMVIVDGVSQFGNGHCLPAGPLREPLSRLKTVDFVVVNGGKIPPATQAAKHVSPMQLIPQPLQNILHPNQFMALSELSGKTLHAAAGIGHPQRFFQQLRTLGCHVIEHAFADHHAYQPSDFPWHDGLPIIMTEKDAIKCRSFAQAHWWYLPVKAQLEEGFCQKIKERVEYFKKAKI